MLTLWAPLELKEQEMDSLTSHMALGPTTGKLPTEHLLAIKTPVQSLALGKKYAGTGSPLVDTIPMGAITAIEARYQGAKGDNHNRP